ncbi:MAG: hypothetical protein MJZ90_10060 [Bacteroidales bacterium]|nr:hypothetical protein [Bacteroidales bacterium]
MKIIKIEVDKLPISCFRDEYYCDCIFLKRCEKKPFYRCALTNKAATGSKRNRFCPLGERPQSEWIDEGLYADYHSEHAYRCKKCGWHIIESPDLIFETRFCKHCGAEMKGGAE